MLYTVHFSQPDPGRLYRLSEQWTLLQLSVACSGEVVKTVGTVDPSTANPVGNPGEVVQTVGTVDPSLANQ